MLQYNHLNSESAEELKFIKQSIFMFYFYNLIQIIFTMPYIYNSYVYLYFKRFNCLNGIIAHNKCITRNISHKLFDTIIVMEWSQLNSV